MTQGELRHAHHRVSPRIVLLALVITLAAASAEFAGSWYDGVSFCSPMPCISSRIWDLRRATHPDRSMARGGEELAAFSVLALVALIALGIVVSSGRRLFATTGAPANPALMGLPVLGLGANLTTAFLFAAPSKKYWSFRAALAHELSDGALTIVGLAGALVIHLFGWRWVDPMFSLPIGLWLWFWAGRLLARWVLRGREAWTLES